MGKCTCPRRWDEQRYGWSQVCADGWTKVVRHAEPSRWAPEHYGVTIMYRGRFRGYGTHEDLAKAKRMAMRMHRELCSGGR